MSFIDSLEPQHERTLYRILEGTALAGTLAAVLVTFVMLGRGAMEVNPVLEAVLVLDDPHADAVVVRDPYDPVWYLAGGAALAAVTTIYAVLRRLQSAAPHVALALAVAVAAIRSWNAVNDVVVFVEYGGSVSIWWTWFLPFAGVMALSAVALFAAPAVARRVPRGVLPAVSVPGCARQLVVIAFSALLVVSIFGPGVVMLPGIDSDHDGTAAAEVENSTFNTSHNVSDQDTYPSGVTFNPDGSTMYVAGIMQDSVIEYSLSTPWHVGSATHVQTAGVNANAGDVEFADKGTKMYVTDSGSQVVYEYDVSTAWDPSTASQVNNLDVSGQTSDPQGVEVKPDGTKLYVSGGGGNVTEYNLSTAYDTSTASHSASHSLSDSGTPYGLEFNGDGTKMMIADDGSDTIDEYNLSTAYDISTTSYSNNNLDVSGQDIYPQGVALGKNGEKLYFPGESNDHVYEYDTNVSGFDTVTGDITGQFTDQYGEPVANATIYTTDYNQSETISIGSRTLDGIMSDPKPEEWQQQIEDLESFNVDQFRPEFGEGEFDTTRVMMHTADDWGIEDWRRFKEGDLGPFVSEPDNPPRPRPVVDSGGGVVFACWTPGGSTLGTVTGLQNVMDRGIPGGETTDCGGIVVERLNPLGATEDTRTMDTQVLQETGYVVNDKDHYGVVTDLDAGVYRVYPEDQPEASLVYTVAPDEDPEQLRPDVENWESACSNGETDQQWHDKVCEKTSEFSTPRTTTNATGHYGLNVNEGRIDRLWIRGVKDGDTMTADETLTAGAIRSEFEATVKSNFEQTAPSGWDPDSYTREEFRDYCQRMPSVGEDIGMPIMGTTTSKVPNDNADIKGVRATPPEISPAVKECAATNFAEDILNNNLGWLTGGFLDDLENLDPHAKLGKLLPLLTANPELKEAIEDETGIALDSENPEDYSDADARQILREGGQMLDTGTGGGGVSVGAGEETVDETAQTISQAWSVEGVENWDDAALLVRLDWSNGTTTTLNTSSEYIGVQENAIGSDEVHLKDYPVGDTDPATVTPRLDVATPDGTDGDSNPGVRNPTFDGTIPGLEYVRLSSMQPGPSEMVTMDVAGDDGLQGLQRVELTRPDGSTETVKPDAGGEVNFTTGGEGTYRLATVVTNPSGTEFTEVLRVKAGTSASSQAPTVRAATGATGRYAVASDGMEGAELTVSNGASHVEVAGILKSNDASQVLVDTTGASVASSVQHDIELRYGPQEQRLDETVGLVLRQPPTSENALYYREGRPVPVDEKGTEGTVRRYRNATVYDSYTAGDGTLTTKTIDDPGWFERIWYSIRLKSPVDPGALGDSATANVGTTLGVAA